MPVFSPQCVFLVKEEPPRSNWVEQANDQGKNEKITGDQMNEKEEEYEGGSEEVRKKSKKEKIKKMEGGPTLYRCEHCPKVYPSQGGLSYHRFIYHCAQYTPPVCDICGKTFRIQKYLDSHKNTVHFKQKDHLCDLCGKGFASKYSLKLHKIWHKGEKNFFCDVCGMRFSTVGKVNAHKQVHGGPKNYICEICSRAFRWKKSLFAHMRTHSGERPYKCEHCERSFSALWNMQQHVRIHTGERPYKCDICGKAFALNASMKEHRNRHNKTTQSETVKLEVDVIKKNSKDVNSEECEDGGNENGDILAEPWRKRLRKKKKLPMKNLTNDVTVKEEYNQPQENLPPDTQVKEGQEILQRFKELPKEEVRNPAEAPATEKEEVEDSLEEEEDSFGNSGNLETDQEENPMDMCEPFSMVETKMEVNEKEHIDPSRYVIVVENQKKKRRKLKEKLRGRTRKRTGEDEYDSKKKRQRKQENPKKKSKKNFACDICREELGNEEELNTHRRMRHINEKSEFFCDFCLKIFKTKAILKGHRYKHITDPQFLCVRCGKKYFTISNLNEHSLYCLDEKKFECPVCNKKFNVNKQFKRHLVIHEADRYIKCTVCEQTFSRKDNYRQHFRRHTGEKPYTCDICGKSFRIKATYNYHRRTHRDVRPGDLENLKTENVTDSDYNAFRTPRKDLPPNVEYYCPRAEGDGDFSIRIPRREGDYGYPSPHKDGALIPEYPVKREPSEGEYPPRKNPEENFNSREGLRKEGKEQKKEGMDFPQRLNVDYLATTVGMDYSKREPARPIPEYYSRKDEYGGREIPPHPEFLPRKVGGVLSEEYQTRGEAEFPPPRRESGGDLEYAPYSNATVREGQD